ncbi:MAG: peptidoglycan bridge formation glycyltransferase FemA/FemB family protein, partial [Candidatus Latescibacteria bacterium]|nr:peptidoglycan bridge formation glycyltransferase FemA/FemB family protein [Candidatus Latescibacterota bacterium]
RERFAEVHRALLGHVSLRGGGGVYQIRRVTLPFYADRHLAEVGGAVLGELGFASQRETTFQVDLHQTHDELWQGLKSSARKNLRKILDGGVLVAAPLDTPADVAAYWEMLVATQRRSRRVISYRTLADFEAKFWSGPHREGVLRGILVRTSTGEPVAGLCFRAYNGWIQELGVAYSEFGIQQRLYGQDLIKWELMRWGHEQGYRSYDLMGVETGSEDPKRRAIYQFKEKWGGALVEYASYSKVYSPWRAAAVRLGTQIGRRLREGNTRRQPAPSREER